MNQWSLPAGTLFLCLECDETYVFTERHECALEVW